MRLSCLVAGLIAALSSCGRTDDIDAIDAGPGDGVAAMGSGGGGAGAAAGGTGGATVLHDGGGARSSAADAAAVDGASGSATESGGGAAAPAGPDKALLYIFSNLYFRHPSIEPAAATLQTLLEARGFSVEISKDPRKFSTANLADLKLVVMISSCGTPLGQPETGSVAALDAWIKAGGAFVGLHAASAVAYAPTSRFVAIMGGRFMGHPGNVRPAVCTPEGTHPSVVSLPHPFNVRDEIYLFDGYNKTNEVDLRCASVNGAPLPIAWHRTEGAGRVFYSALGHEISVWQADSPLVKDHVLPGILWALGR